MMLVFAYTTLHKIPVNVIVTCTARYSNTSLVSTIYMTYIGLCYIHVMCMINMSTHGVDGVSGANSITMVASLWE